MQILLKRMQIADFAAKNVTCGSCNFAMGHGGDLIGLKVPQPPKAACMVTLDSQQGLARKITLVARFLGRR